MRVLSIDECGVVAGAEACQYVDLNTMLANSAAVGSVGAMAGFFLGGPVVGGIAGAGTAASSLAAHGFYNFFTLIVDLAGGCNGYTSSC